MATTELTKPKVTVPALAHTPALDIDSDDIKPPRIKIGQYGTKQVQEDLVKAGQFFASSSDTDATLLLDPKKDEEGLLFHVLSLRKGKSATVDGEFRTFAFSDPYAPEDARVTYDYTVCLPEHDTDMPYKWLITGMSTPVAKQINTVLKKNEARGPALATAFRVSSVPRENPKGKFFVAAKLTIVDATQEGVDASAALANLLASSPIVERSETTERADEPAI